MPSVQRLAPDAALAVVGDGPERATLTQIARDSGAAVQFVGRVDDDSLAGYLQAADVVCSPALGGESFGIVLLEAMACGKPIVASRIDGYEALVGASEAARLVPPGDSAALATEISWLFGSAERRRTLGGRGSALAAGYDWPMVAQRLESIYRGVLDRATLPREQRRVPDAVPFDEIGPVVHHAGELPCIGSVVPRRPSVSRRKPRWICLYWKNACVRPGPSACSPRSPSRIRWMIC